MIEMQEIVADDGHRFQVRYCGGEEKPTVVFFPAMGVRASFYDQLLTALSHQGYRAVCHEWRGHGSSDKRASHFVDYGYEDFVTRDMKATIEAFGAQGPVRLAGHSLGGQLSLLYAARYPDQVESIALFASCLVHFKGYDGSVLRQLKLLRRLLPVLLAAFGYFPGDRLGFAGREAKTQMRDWMQNGIHGTYNLEGTDFDYEAALKAMTKPVLARGFLHDTYAPQRAIQLLLAKMPAAEHDFSMIRQGGYSLDHYRWAREGAADVASVFTAWDQR